IRLCGAKSFPEGANLIRGQKADSPANGQVVGTCRRRPQVTLAALVADFYRDIVRLNNEGRIPFGPILEAVRDGRLVQRAVPTNAALFRGLLWFRSRRSIALVVIADIKTQDANLLVLDLHLDVQSVPVRIVHHTGNFSRTESNGVHGEVRAQPV